MRLAQYSLRREAPTSNALQPMSIARLFVFIVLALTLAACESAVGPLAERDDTDGLGEWSARRVAVCHAVEASSYSLITVTQDVAHDHLAHGDELAGGAVLDAQCQPVTPPSSCVCFSAADLAEPLAGAAPAPYVFFDVFDYYGEDPRRTEVRSTLSMGHGEFEEVAAVYITPTDDADAPLFPFCFSQNAVLDSENGGVAYDYTTRALSISEAESCRLEIEMFAESETTCQGGACDLPYMQEQLDPAFPPYHEAGYRTPPPILDAIQAEIASVRKRFAPEA